MSHHSATVIWNWGDDVFTGGRYSRAHLWQFDGGVSVTASAAPDVVPLPFSRADAVDPEEAFVAALASCHMLFFLDLARQAGFVVDSYRDQAVGEMGKPVTLAIGCRLCICIPKPHGRVRLPTAPHCQICTTAPTSCALSPIQSNPRLSRIWTEDLWAEDLCAEDPWAGNWGLAC